MGFQVLRLALLEVRTGLLWRQPARGPALGLAPAILNLSAGGRRPLLIIQIHRQRFTDQRSWIFALLLREVEELRLALRREVDVHILQVKAPIVARSTGFRDKPMRSSLLHVAQRAQPVDPAGFDPRRLRLEFLEARGLVHALFERCAQLSQQRRVFERLLFERITLEVERFLPKQVARDGEEIPRRLLGRAAARPRQRAEDDQGLAPHVFDQFWHATRTSDGELSVSEPSRRALSAHEFAIPNPESQRQIRAAGDPDARPLRQTEGLFFSERPHG